MPKKVCTKCGDEKDLEGGFHKDKSRKDGRCYWCKICSVPASSSWRKRNPDRIAQKNVKYITSDPIKYLLVHAKHRAKTRGMEFSITEKDIIIPERCPILNIPLFRGHRNNPNSPSIDRVNNEAGYVSGNVSVISNRANELKRDATITELKLLAKWVGEQYGT